MSGRPGCCANVVAFQVPVGRFAVPSCCVTFPRSLGAAVVECYAGAGWLGEADGDVADRRIGDVAPVFPAALPFSLGYVLILVGVVPVGEVAAPVLRVEGFRVVGVFGEHLEYDGVFVGSAHDDRVVEDV